MLVVIMLVVIRALRERVEDCSVMVSSVHRNVSVKLTRLQ